MGMPSPSETAASAPLGQAFTRVWAASTISNLGDGVFGVALPLLAAALTRDPVLVALVAVAAQLPWLLFSLFSGALVDRWDRRRVMWATDLYRMLIVGLLAFAVITDRASIPLLVVVGFLLAIGEMLFDNAAQSILPSVVAPAQLERANSRLYAAQAATNDFIGGPLGAAMFGVARSVPFVADAVSFGLSAILISTLPEADYRAEQGVGDTSLWTEIREGLSWLWKHRLLRTLSAEVGVINFWFMAYVAVFVLHAQDNLGVSNLGFGLLVASGGVGAFVGAATASRISAAFPPGKLLLTAVVGFGAALAVIGATSSPTVAGIAIFTTGIISMVWNVVTVSLRQAITPDTLLGRVNSAYQIASMGSLSLGALAGGFLASWFGLRSPMIIGGAVVALTAVLVTPIVSTPAIEQARAQAT